MGRFLSGPRGGLWGGLLWGGLLWGGGLADGVSGRFLRLGDVGFKLSLGRANGAIGVVELALRVADAVFYFTHWIKVFAQALVEALIGQIAGLLANVVEFGFARDFFQARVEFAGDTAHPADTLTDGADHPRQIFRPDHDQRDQGDQHEFLPAQVKHVLSP
ncbi:MAG: hypothetical protein VXX13_02955, partial [Pseudomonadota bacterium]|nr:hypothetical protein [Pseudomonadota bacterium]